MFILLRKNERNGSRIKKFTLKTFNETSYIKRVYLRGSTAHIPIRFSSLSEMLDVHDPLNQTLTNEFCAYVDKKAYEIPYHCSLQFEISCPDADEHIQKIVEDAFRVRYGIMMEDKRGDHRRELYKALTMVLVGGSLFVLSLLGDSLLTPFIYGALDIIAWVSLWDALEYFIFEYKDLKMDWLSAAQLYSSKISFAPVPTSTF